VEVIADGAKLVGVEGGEHAAFKAPPYYDPRALQHHRVILAAFSTSAALPAAEGSPLRIARLHWMIEESTTPRFKLQAIVTADADGMTIEAAVSLREGDQQ